MFLDSRLRGNDNSGKNGEKKSKELRVYTRSILEFKQSLSAVFFALLTNIFLNCFLIYTNR